MEILCTNDDGILSPGLAAAVEVARGFGDVRVVAPSGQQTAAGRSLMGTGTSRCEARIAGDTGSVPAWQLDANTALAVRHGFATVVRDRRFDLAVSGDQLRGEHRIRHQHSATVGAANRVRRQGDTGHRRFRPDRFQRAPSVPRIDWTATQHFLRLIIRRFIEKADSPVSTVLKLDVPMGADERTEWKVLQARAGPYYMEQMTRQSDDAVVADCCCPSIRHALRRAPTRTCWPSSAKVAVTPWFSIGPGTARAASQ